MPRRSKEAENEYQREWRRKNAQRVRDSALKSYHKTRDAKLPKMREYSKQRYQKDRRLSLFEGAKRRAKLEGLPFDITIDDIIIPDVCPVLGTPIECGHPSGHPNLPSLDKFIPMLGYVRGNIAVISYRANSLKRDGSLEDIERLYTWMKAHITQ